MSDMLDRQTLEIACPHCGEKSKETIGRLKHSPTLECAACKNLIKIDADEMRQIVDSLQAQLDKIARVFK